MRRPTLQKLTFLYEFQLNFSLCLKLNSSTMSMIQLPSLINKNSLQLFGFLLAFKLTVCVQASNQKIISVQTLDGGIYDTNKTVTLVYMAALVFVPLK